MYLYFLVSYYYVDIGKLPLKELVRVPEEKYIHLDDLHPLRQFI